MPVKFDVDDGIASVTLSRPDALNALDLEMMDALVDAWDRIERDDSISVAILKGDGDRAFCAGADLKALVPQITSGGVQQAVAADGNVFLKLLLSKPVVAAIRGVCVAGGTELIQATDIRVASQDAVFGLPEVKWALMPGGGSTVRLPRQIPYCKAMEMLLTGDFIDAAEAYRIGLVNAVVPSSEVDSKAEEYARRIAANGPVAVRAVKRSALETWGMALTDAFRIEAELAAGVFASDDAKEGPKAFAEKRAPNFTGRTSR